jgi:hypothetical protein
LNELDSAFQLPEGPYTFEYERQARDIMEAAYAEYTKSSRPTQDQPPAVVPSSLSSITPPAAITGTGTVQEGLGPEGTGGQGDAVIDITLPADSEKVNGGEVDDSGVAVGSERPEMP